MFLGYNENITEIKITYIVSRTNLKPPVKRTLSPIILMDEGKQSLGEELQIAWSGRKSAVIPCAMARSDRRAWNRLLPVQDSPRASGLTTGGTASAQGSTYCTILLIRYYHTLLT